MTFEYVAQTASSTPVLQYSCLPFSLNPGKKVCWIGNRRIYIRCNTGDPGLEDVVGPESIWDSPHRLRLFLNVQATSVGCSWDGRNWCSPSEVLERSRKLR